MILSHNTRRYVVALAVATTAVLAGAGPTSAKTSERLTLEAINATAHADGTGSLPSVEVTYRSSKRTRTAQGSFSLRVDDGTFPAADSPAGFERIARRADGWLPVGMPAEVIGAIWSGIRQAAEGFGRNPDDLQLVVRANVKVTPTTHDGDRAPFTGTIAQIAGDVGASADAGVNELILDVQADARTGEEVIDLAHRIVDAAGIKEGQHVLVTAAPH